MQSQPLTPHEANASFASSSTSPNAARAADQHRQHLQHIDAAAARRDAEGYDSGDDMDDEDARCSSSVSSSRYHEKQNAWAMNASAAAAAAAAATTTTRSRSGGRSSSSGGREDKNSNNSNSSSGSSQHGQRTIPLWVIAGLWILLISNIVFVFGYLFQRPISSPSGPVPKWQRQQQSNASGGNDDDDPAPPLIDPLWLYAALPFLFLPTIVVFSYVNWLGWQFFKHN